MEMDLHRQLEVITEKLCLSVDSSGSLKASVGSNPLLWHRTFTDEFQISQV
jgi:hypothetical protein